MIVLPRFSLNHNNISCFAVSKHFTVASVDAKDLTWALLTQ